MKTSESQSGNLKAHLLRMQRVINHWRKLDWVDHEFLLRKFRDENPKEFWQVANEKRLPNA